MVKKTRVELPENLQSINMWVSRVVKFFTWYGGLCFLSFIILPLFDGFDGLVKFFYWTGFFVMILFTIFELFVDIHGEKFLGTIGKIIKRS